MTGGELYVQVYGTLDGYPPWCSLPEREKAAWRSAARRLANEAGDREGRAYSDGVRDTLEQKEACCRS